MEFVYYMVLHATESVTFPLGYTFSHSTRWALRNNVCRTALFSQRATHTRFTSPKEELSVTLLPSAADTDGCSNVAVHLDNVVCGWALSEETHEPRWRIPVPPSSFRVHVAHAPHHEARFETASRQLSLYGLHSDTHEMIAVSDCANLDQAINQVLPKAYWHQRLAGLETGDCIINTQRVFSRWQRWRQQRLSLSQRYAALEAALLHN